MVNIQKKFMIAYIGLVCLLNNYICYADIIEYSPNSYWGYYPPHRRSGGWDTEILFTRLGLSWLLIILTIACLGIIFKIRKEKEGRKKFIKVSSIIVIAFAIFSLWKIISAIMVIS